MFQAVVQFRDPHQQPQPQQHAQNQKPPLHPLSSSSSSSTDSSGSGPPPAGSSTTLPNRRSRRKKSLLYQVLMSPLRKKSGSTNTLNTVANNATNQQQQVQGNNVSLFKIYLFNYLLLLLKECRKYFLKDYDKNYNCFADLS